MACAPVCRADALAGRSQKPAIEIQTDELEELPDVSVIAADELRVKNTFIDVGPTPSMDRFLRERMALSCPGSRVGQLDYTFGRSANMKNSLRAPCASEPAVISLADALAEIPTMPSTPEPLYDCWQPLAPEVPSISCTPLLHLQQPLTFEAEAPAILRQHGGHAAAAVIQQLPIGSAPQQALAAGWSPRDISLLAATSQPVPVPDKFPSIGSAGHSQGDCKPCAFLHSKGCSSGSLCKFCHLCAPGEKKRRQKDKKQGLRQDVFNR